MNMKRKTPKTYEVEHHGRKVRVSVPARHETVTYSGDGGRVLQDILGDSLSPQAVAALANAIRVQLHSVKDAAVKRQLRWFEQQLVAMISEEQYRRLCVEAGL
jgi:hypothetical protein